jgi:hypothetical protein
MALSKQIQLAHAQRRLRRLEEDAAEFRRQLTELPEHHRKPMQRWFEDMVQQERDVVRRLEVSSSERGRRSSAA